MYCVTLEISKFLRKDSKVKLRTLKGFSLMEMMVVLLIVSIVAAASAPMITKK